MHFSPLLISTVVVLLSFNTLAAPVSSSGATSLGLSKRDVASDAATVLGATGGVVGTTAGNTNSIAGTAGYNANTLAGTATGSAVTIAKNGGSNVEDSTKALVNKRDVFSDRDRVTIEAGEVGVLEAGADLKKRQNDRGGHFCPGGLIRVGREEESDIVVTAAHCVYDGTAS